MSSATASVIRSVTTGPGDAVEEAEHRIERDAQRRAEHARKPIVERELQGTVGNAERREYRRAAEGEGREHGNDGERGPERSPRGLRGAAVAPSAVGLRHQGLHGQAHAAE